jgi:hypothetical protein
MSTPDQSSTQTSSPQHATFVDERPEDSDPIVNAPPIAPTARLTAPDLKMTAENLLQNPIQIATFDWTTTDARETVLDTFDLPNAFTSVNSFQSTMLSIFAYLKCNLVLTFKLNSTRFHQGALWPFVDPMHQMLDSQPPPSVMSKFVNIWSASSQPRVEIDAAQSNPAILRIPYVHIQDRLTTNSKETWDVMARVRVLVASPLRAATGSNGTVTCQVFLHCEDVSLDDPIYPHVPTIPALMHSDDVSDDYPLDSHRPPTPFLRDYPTVDQIRTLITENNRLANRMIANNAAIRALLFTVVPCPVEMHGAALSAASKTVDGATGAAYNVMTGNYGKAATSASKGLEGLGEGLSLLNLDKPADPSAAVCNYMSPYAPLSHGTGVDCSVRLGNAPLGAYLENRFASGISNDMDIYSRVQIPGLVEILQWTVDDLPGAVLLSVPVMPAYTHVLPVTDPAFAPGYSAVYNTNLSYHAEMFVYWRMSMIYMLKAYCSQFHSGRLMLTFTPNQRLTTPADLSQYTNLPAVYFDIQGNTLSTVAVPFHSSLTRKTWAPWANIPSRTQYTDQHILGYMDIVVFNRLVAPSNVSPNIELFLFQAAASDVEFESPRLLSTTGFVVPTLSVSAPSHAEMHSEEDDLTSRSAPQPEFLSKTPTPATRMNVFNEGVRDVRDLTRRYTPLRFYSLALEVVGTNGSIINPYVHGFSTAATDLANIPVTPLLHSGDIFFRGSATPVNLNYSTAQNFSNRIARTNVFYHGGMRYKIAPLCNRTQSLLMTATYIPDFGIIPQTPGFDLLSIIQPNLSYSTHMTNTSQNASLQVETPFMSGYNQICIETVEPASTFPPDVTRAGHLQILGITDDPTAFPLTIALPPTFPTPTPALSFALFMSTADDAVFHYAVAPPVTYSATTLVAPPV